MIVLKCCDTIPASLSMIFALAHTIESFVLVLIFYLASFIQDIHIREFAAP